MSSASFTVSDFWASVAKLMDEVRPSQGYRPQLGPKLQNFQCKAKPGVALGFYSHTKYISDEEEAEDKLLQLPQPGRRVFSNLIENGMRLSGFGMQISGLVQQMPDLVYPCLMHKEGGSSENFFQSMKTDKKADLDFVWDLLSNAKEKAFAGRGHLPLKASEKTYFEDNGLPLLPVDMAVDPETIMKNEEMPETERKNLKRRLNAVGAAVQKLRPLCADADEKDLVVVEGSTVYVRVPEPRPDWFGSVSLQAMWVVLLEKFIGPYAAEENKTILLAVVNNLEIEELVEVQQPGDHLDDKWTECNGNGLNLLGKMLTQLVLALRTKDVQKAHRMLEWNAEFEAELRSTIGVDLYHY